MSSKIKLEIATECADRAEYCSLTDEGPGLSKVEVQIERSELSELVEQVNEWLPWVNSITQSHFEISRFAIVEFFNEVGEKFEPEYHREAWVFLVARRTQEKLSYSIWIRTESKYNPDDWFEAQTALDHS